MASPRGEGRQHITFVIPALNAAKTLVPCLDAVRQAIAAWGPADAVLVDNGSSDRTRELAEEALRGTGQVHQASGSVAALRNLGARLARGDVLAFVDADCQVPPGYLVRAAASLDRSGAAAVGGAYALPSHPHWLERAWWSMHDAHPDGPAEWLYGGNCVVHRAPFEAVKGFDERLTSGEDVDFCLRLREKGFTLAYDRVVSVVHLGNPHTLREFFAQQRWHATGMIATARGLDRPLVMTLTHVLLSVAALCTTVGTRDLLVGLVAGVLSQATVPAVTVAFRMIQGRRLVHPLPSILLYWVYYWARTVAVIKTLTGWIPAARRRAHG
jgi:GT2 family glycosyltransferase